MPSDRSFTAANADGEDQDLRPTRKGGNPLQRGSACLSCRKRKMKCDATKPVCRQCIKANRAEECDYDDGRQKSRTQILQEKIAKLEDRIRELESAEAEQLSLDEEQDGYNEPARATGYGYDSFGAQTTVSGQGSADEATYHGPGNSAEYHSSSHSPAASGSGSDSSRHVHSMSYSPLVLDGSNPASSYNPSPGPVAGTSVAGYPSHQHQQHQHNAFDPTQGMAAPGPRDIFGYNMNLGMDLGIHLNMGAGYDSSSLALGLDTSAHHMIGMNLDMSMPTGMSIGMNPSVAFHGPSSSLSVPAYSIHNFSPLAGVASSSQSAFSDAASSGVNPIPGASSMSVRPPPPPPTSSFLGSGFVPNSSHQPLGMGASSLSLSGGIQAMSGQCISAASASTSKGKRPMSRWDADVLPIQERKILVDIFLPHARQCGVYLSPERLYQRLELDSSYPSLFPPPTHSAQGDLRAPPAHPALANAIYLLACHFSSVHIPGTAFPQFEGLSGKQTDLSAHESQFLTRVLRGIAAALEAGEAAATDSVSSRSSRSARSRSRSMSANVSMRGSASPPTFSTSSSASGFQSTSRPGTANPGPSGSGSGVGSGVVTGLGGGVKEDPPDAATPLVDAVQASALLAVYFFAKARLLEGYYHASAAARLAVSLGMHQVRSAVWKPPAPSSLPSGSIASSTFGTSDSSNSSNSSTSFAYTGPSDPNAGSWSGSPTPSPAVLLPPARCALEHNERISTFWHVFFIDRCWSVATGLPSSLPDDDHPQLKISTVWPWDVEPGKEMTRETADYESLGSLFVPNAFSRHGGRNNSTKALKAKAAAFFERAARIASLQAEPTQWEQLTQLEVALDNFIASLPPYTSTSATVPDSTIDPDLALVHTLSHASVIQLHHPRAQKDGHAHAVCVRAAAVCVQIIRCLPAKDFIFLDPVMGTCWMCASDVLLRERMWGGNMSAAHGIARGTGEVQCTSVETELDAVVGALKQLSYVFPVALYQVQKVEQSRNTAY